MMMTMIMMIMIMMTMIMMMFITWYQLYEDDVCISLLSLNIAYAGNKNTE